MAPDQGANYPVLFSSLSNICLDELVFAGKDPLVDIVGGPGAYATLGARIFAKSPASKSVGWLMRVGNDFPATAQSELNGWEISLSVKTDENRPSARGLQQYDDNTFGPVLFRELSPAFDFDAADLRGTAALRSVAFHLLATPEMCSRYIPEIRQLRLTEDIEAPPYFVWEPEPRTSLKDHFEMTMKAAQNVNVLSPNHLELRRLFEDKSSVSRPSVAEVEKYAQLLIDRGFGPKGRGILVVRAAELGCMVQSPEFPKRWFPAFFEPSHEDLLRAQQGEEVPYSSCVVDPTGAGNTFLGAFALELATSGDLVEAAIRGTIAASFTIEQIAFPKLTRKEGINGSGTELWNGISATDRLSDYKNRLGGHPRNRE